MATKEERSLEKIQIARKIEKWISKGYTDVEACHKVKVSTDDYVKMRAENPELQTGYQRAVEEQVQWYEKTARKRAVKGYTEITRDANGKVMKSVHKYDSDMLIKMLAARDKRYRTAVKANDVTVNFDFAGKLQEARDRAKKLKKAE